MTNKQKQEHLDKQRWIRSENAKHDLGGSFNYCNYCDYKSTPIGTPYYNPCPHCNTTYEQRVKETPCAKAYNKYYHSKHK